MSDENKQPILPYVSYPTFKAIIRHLHETVVTDQIDNTMMPSGFSGSSRAAVTSALKSLGLIDAQNNTTQKLKDLVDAYDTQNWPAIVKRCVLSSYAEITGGVELKSATRKQVNEMFKDTTPQMRDKCIRFFLSANKEADVEYSPHLKIRRRLPKKRIDTASPKKKVSGKKESRAQEEISEVKKTSANMFDQPIPIASDDNCFIRVPRNISVSEVELVKAAVAFIEAMAKQNKNKSE